MRYLCFGLLYRIPARPTNHEGTLREIWFLFWHNDKKNESHVASLEVVKFVYSNFTIFLMLSANYKTDLLWNMKKKSKKSTVCPIKNLLLELNFYWSMKFGRTIFLSVNSDIPYTHFEYYDILSLNAITACKSLFPLF